MARNFCVKCGKPLAEKDRFCMFCGAPVEVQSVAAGPAHAAPAPRPQPAPAPAPAQLRCPTCGKPYEAGDRFCMGCGASLAAAGPAAPAARPTPAPAQATSAPAPEKPHKVPFWKRRKHQAEPAAPAQAAWQPPAVSPGVMGGDEETSVLTEPGVPGPGNDEATTVLTSVRVTLERQRTGESLELTLPCVVGKGSAAECRVTGNTAISRRHVRLYTEDVTGAAPKVLVEDLGSLNKSRLNGDPLPPSTPRAVLNGDRLTLADEDFVVRIDQ